MNGGKCGLCGDNWSDAIREHETPNKVKMCLNSLPLFSAHGRTLNNDKECRNPRKKPIIYMFYKFIVKTSKILNISIFLVVCDWNNCCDLCA